MKRNFLNALSLLFCFSMMAAAHAKLPPGYGVSQSGNLVFVKTPFGSSIYIGPVGLDSLPNFEFEIPLSDFRAGLPGGAPTASGPSNENSNGGPSAVGDDGSLIAEANRLYNRGDFNHALQYVDELSRRSPKNIRAWIMKGSLMHVLGHNDLARQSWEKALALDPSNTQIENILKEMK
jgi:tetratricopeptide (TPR) repeat protein